LPTSISTNPGKLAPITLPFVLGLGGDQAIEELKKTATPATKKLAGPWRSYQDGRLLLPYGKTDFFF